MFHTSISVIASLSIMASREYCQYGNIVVQGYHTTISFDIEAVSCEVPLACIIMITKNSQSRGNVRVEYILSARLIFPWVSQTRLKPRIHQRHVSLATLGEVAQCCLTLVNITIKKKSFIGIKRRSLTGLSCVEILEDSLKQRSSNKLWVMKMIQLFSFPLEDRPFLLTFYQHRAFETVLSIPNNVFVKNTCNCL